MRNDEPLKVYEGRGPTIDEALEHAAERALIDDRARNLGAEFAILRHVVRLENPRISEHIITIGG